MRIARADEYRQAKNELTLHCIKIVATLSNESTCSYSKRLERHFDRLQVYAHARSADALPAKLVP